MKLHSNWKQCYKWYSVHAMVIASAIQAMWLAMPEDAKSTLNPKIVNIMTIILMVNGVIGRVVNQDKANVKP